MNEKPASTKVSNIETHGRGLVVAIKLRLLKVKIEAISA